MTKEQENIVLSKRFFELTSEELLKINEVVTNEEEFDQLRAFLLQIHAVNSASESVPAEVKSNLNHLFDQRYNASRLAWYNKLWVFLWPENSQLHQRPLIQFASLTLVILLAATLYPENEKAQLAMNHADKKEDNEVAEQYEEEINITSDQQQFSDRGQAEQESLKNQELLPVGYPEEVASTQVDFDEVISKNERIETTLASDKVQDNSAFSTHDDQAMGNALPAYTVRKEAARAKKKSIATADNDVLDLLTALY